LLKAGRAAAGGIDWGTVPEPKKLTFSDPEADRVLDRAVSELDRVLSEAEYSRGKRFRKYSVKYVVKKDGSAKIVRDFEIVARGQYPLSCMAIAAHGGSGPTHLSFDDLNVEAEDKTGEPCKVCVVPTRNTATRKHIGLFFLPAVLPKETRTVSVTQDYPGCFRRLVEYEADEIGVDQKEPVEDLSVWLEFDTSLGDIEFGEPIGPSARLVKKHPPTSEGNMVRRRWTIQVEPAPERIAFRVPLRRREERAAS
jgi:hypothetical protein